MKRLIAAALFLSLAASAQEQSWSKSLRSWGYLPYPRTEVESARFEVAQALAGLDAQLSVQTPEVKASWWKYLSVDLVVKVARGENKNVPQIDEALWYYYRNQKALELPTLLRMREALGRYRDALAVDALTDDKLAAEFTTRRDRLADLIDAAETRPTSVDHFELGGLLAWMEQAKQTPGWPKAIRQRFERPNFSFSLSEKLLLTSFQSTPINRSERVTDNFQGTSIFGIANFSGATKAELTPNPNRGNIDIVLDGVIHSQATGVNGPATVQTSGTTVIQSRASLVLTPFGLQLLPAQTSASTSSQINSIDVDPRGLLFRGFKERIGERIAWRRALESKPEADAYAAQRAAERSSAALDEEIRKRAGSRIDELNQVYRDMLYWPLFRHAIFPHDMTFSTANNRIYGRGVMSNASQFGGIETPPALAADSDATLQVHESVLNNFLEAAYGWYVGTDQYVETFARTLLGDVPQELWVFDGAPRWTAKMARRMPVTVKLGAKEVIVTFRLLDLKRTDKPGSGPVTATARFALSKDGNDYRASRIGEAEIKFESTDASGKEPRAFAEAKLRALFPREPGFPNFGLPEGTEGADTLPKLDNTRFEIGNGWISASWKVR